MEVKLFEVRDSATFIPAIAIDMSTMHMPEAERYLASRVGYGLDRLILFGKACDGKMSYNSFEHSKVCRTMQVAHDYVTEHWNELTSGAVIDVQFIEGETTVQKISERLSSPSVWRVPRH